jgi:hypothetical protein
MEQVASFVARWRVTILVLALVAALSGAWVADAKADGPGSGTASVAALGDSYMSGEAGRWAGNSNEEPTWVDALGSHAHHDNEAHRAEAIAGCHRSLSAATTSTSPRSCRTA